MIDVVAVGCDGSSTAGEAVDWAADLARHYDAKLVLLSAFHAGDDRPADEHDWTTSSAAVVRENLGRHEERLRAEGIDCSTSVDEGKAAEVLVRLAEECEADVLVVGNRGMQRRVLGSVPNTVTHRAPCSVLVVKTT